VFEPEQPAGLDGGAVEPVQRQRPPLPVGQAPGAAVELRERLADPGERRRPRLELLAEVHRVCDTDQRADRGRGIVGVGRGAVRGQPEGPGDRAGVVEARPHQPEGEVPQQRVFDDPGLQLVRAPPAPADHGLFEAADLLGGDRAHRLLQRGEPGERSGGKHRVVPGGWLGRRGAAGAVLVGDDRLQLLVEADGEPARTVVEQH
jgi:hypothetical protein